jgi:hypothetical protein
MGRYTEELKRARVLANDFAALEALRAELEANRAQVKNGSWDYRLLVVDDPDGNLLHFNYPDERGSAGSARCNDPIEAEGKSG